MKSAKPDFPVATSQPPLAHGHDGGLRRHDESRSATDIAALIRTLALSGKLYVSGGLGSLLQEVADAAVEAKVAAEAANNSKSRLLANISHELRTTMNAILGMMEVALPRAVDPIIKDCLQTAKDSGGILLTLLNDLLDSAKIASGKLELEVAPFSLRQTLDQIARTLSARSSEKGLWFRCNVPDETPDALMGDRTRLQQVLLNLVGNAIKFTESGGVEISLRVVSNDAASQKIEPKNVESKDTFAVLEFAVRDTGIGIPKEAHDGLFVPYGQADASLSRRLGGTGLGLSISKNLVEMMGGRIWLQSAPGRGSTFYFTLRLPLAAEIPASRDLNDHLSPAPERTLQLLLVEDNPANQKFVSHFLRGRGHSVEIAGDGQQAVELCRINSYDLIMMDLQMPAMDGIEATAAVRKEESDGCRVPIIAMTAHAMQSDRDRCLAADMDGYLAKPVNVSEMIRLVESLASRSAT